MPLIIAHF